AWPFGALDSGREHAVCNSRIGFLISFHFFSANRFSSEQHRAREAFSCWHKLAKKVQCHCGARMERRTALPLRAATCRARSKRTPNERSSDRIALSSSPPARARRTHERFHQRRHSPNAVGHSASHRRHELAFALAEIRR